ncbi:uncharacterized protein [Hoplias malabaricus]|uniref:uncharacterized protein n=1 Tax=Hoplias malabaricus TaxID=27720 RepID=UPI003461DBB7
MAHTSAMYTLLLSFFITGCVCGSVLRVWQCPEIINTTEYKQVRISCHFSVGSVRRWVQITVEWFNNNNKTDFPNEQLNISENTNNTNYTSVLLLPSVRVNDSGVYYCRVWESLPVLGDRVSGPGTELRVGAAGFSAVIPALIPASVSGSVLITAFVTFAVIYFIYKSRRKKHREEQGEQVEEVPSVLYTALKFTKPQDTTPGGPPQSDTEVVDSEVLYSDVRLKQNKTNKHQQVEAQSDPELQ